MKIHIQNMVCFRCKMAVRSELEHLGLHCVSIDLGEAETKEDISEVQMAMLDSELRKVGLVLINDNKNILIEKVKTSVIKLVHHSDQQLKINLSDYLSNELHHNYTYLANLFSEEKGISIEKFYLMHKIERVKELLVYNDLNLTQIAEKMHYSSVAHLSNQFKKMTGLTPTQFKGLKNQKRAMLEDI